MVKWQMALKTLFLAYNGTALSGLDATGMAFRKSTLSGDKPPRFFFSTSIFPSSGRKLCNI